MATTTKQNNQYCTTAPSIDANIGPWASIEAYLAWLSSELGVETPQEGTEILVKDNTGAMTKYRYEVISGTPTWTTSASEVAVDSALDTTSDNPVKNKVVAAAIANLQSAATSANNSAAAAAQSLATIQQAIANLDPSTSTEDAITALTAQVAALGPEIYGRNEEQTLTIEQGAINSSGGESTNNKMLRTIGYINSATIKVEIQSGKYMVVGYNEEGFIAQDPSSWRTEAATVAITGATKYRMMFAKSDGTAIAVSYFENLGVKVYVQDESTRTVLKKTDVVNDLTTGGTGAPLSAEMGKTLQTQLAAQNVELTSAINAVDGRIDNIGFDLHGGTVNVDMTTNGYIKNDGTMSASSSYRRSDYLYVQEGMAIQFNGVASSSVCMIAAFSDKGLAYFDLSKSVLGTGEEITTSYIVPSGIKYVILSRNTTVSTDVTLTYTDLKGLIGDAVRSVNGYTLNVTFPNGAYIKTDGTVTSSVSYGASDFIPVTTGQRINFTTRSSASVLAMSAYSSASQSSFISGSTANISGYDGDVEVDVTIPEGVNYIRICKSNTYSGTISIAYKGVNEKISEVAASVSSIKTNASRQYGMPHFKSTSPRKACVCFQMDWGYRAGATCDAYAAVLAQYGVKHSTYLVEPVYFSQDVNKMLALYEEGNEIGLHTDSNHSDIGNSSTLTTAEFNALMCQYRQEMLAAGFEDYTGCVVLSTNLKSTFMPEIVKHHNWQIAGSVDFSAIETSVYHNAAMGLSDDFRFPKRLGVELTQEQADGTNEVVVANRAIEMIDDAVENCGFLIIYCHSYDAANATYTLRSESLVPILQHLQLLIQKGLVLTGRTSDLLEYYYSKRFGE